MTRSRNHYITIYKSITGWKAVMRAEYEDSPGVWFPDNVQTGLGAYSNPEDAREEGKRWAKEEEIPFVD